MRRFFSKHWYAWAMVAPVVVVLAVLILYPLGRGIYLSFTNTTEANQLSEICTDESATAESDAGASGAGRGASVVAAASLL